MSRTHGDPEGQWRALARRPGYLSFTTTVVASRIVSAMFNTAGVLLVLDRTGVAALVGLLVLAGHGPGWTLPARSPCRSARWPGPRT